MTNTLSAPADTDTPLPAPRAAAPPPGYFERPGPAAVILGSFLAVTLPVAAMVLAGWDGTWLGTGYLWLFGATHLVLTVTVYCTRANLRHFTSSTRNLVVFLGVPLGILVTFAAVHGLNLFATVPAVVGLLYAGVRVFNFLHLTRQTFGVYQLFKARTRAKFPAWAKGAENASGLALVGALFATDLAGGWCPLLLAGGPLSLGDVPPLYAARLPLGWLQVGWVAFAALALGLYAAAVVQVPRTRRGLTAALYLTAQTAGTFAAAVFLPLYLAALAMHYVEYHVLMYPRVFRLPLDPTSRLDRGYGWVRSRPAVFVGLLLLLAAGVTGGMSVMAPAAAGGAWVGLLVLFDVCVAAHYFLEMHIWRFSDPHFRETLGGLYFAPKVAS